jgi:Outer membrane efflux protein
MPFLRIAAVLLLVAAVENQAQAGWFSINDAISQAVLTNPGVGEASANRRATEAELRQAQGTLLPQVRLETRLGPEKFDQQIIPPPIGNNKWLPGRSASVVVRQVLFDGFASIHDIWRQSARVNAASFRVRERSELTALDAAEAYIDVVRYQRLVALANQKLIVPAFVVVGNDGCPACVPGGSPLRGPSPASNTMVAGPPGDGIVTTGVGVSALKCPIDERSTSVTAFFSCSPCSSANGAELAARGSILTSWKSAPLGGILPAVRRTDWSSVIGKS